MKKKRFNDGGYTDQEASDLMKNDVVPKRSTYLTSDEPATPQSAEDTAAENAALAREAAQEARRSAPRVPAPRVAVPDMVSDQISRNAPRPRLGNQNDYSMNAQEGSGNINYGGGAAARAPSRGDSSRNGPIGDAVDAITRGLRNLPHNKQLRKERLLRERPLEAMPMKKGGAVKASKRADGIAQRGKTKGRFV